MSETSITNMAKSLLRKVNGSNALLVKFASNTAKIKDALAQNTAELAALRAQSDGLTAGLRQQIVQLEKRLEQVSGEQAKTHAKLERVLHRQNQIIKPSHDIRLQLATQEIKTNGFWFIDIPRTSSSSVRVELGRHFGPTYIKGANNGSSQLVGDHIFANQMSRRIGQKAFGELLSFTIVRNPWARAYSFYRLLHRENTIPHEWSFADYCQRICDVENHQKFFRNQHNTARMVDHICDESGNVIVSQIIRFEDRQKGLDEIAQKIGCPSLGAYRVVEVSDTNYDYRSKYTPETQKLIGDYYAKDVALLGYEF